MKTLMRKELLIGLVVVSLVFGMMGSANALTITSYTNSAAWTAAAGGPVNLETFNNPVPEPNGAFTAPRDVGDFTISRQGPAISMAFAGSGGSKRLLFGSTNHNQRMNWDFDFGISALGFNWGNTDTNDSLRLIIDGQPLIFGGPLDMGFYGIVADGGFTRARIADSNGGGGSLQYGIFKRVKYVEYVEEPIPEPATCALFGIGLVGLVGAAARRKFKKEKRP